MAEGGPSSSDLITRRRVIAAGGAAALGVGIGLMRDGNKSPSTTPEVVEPQPKDPTATPEVTPTSSYEHAHADKELSESVKNTASHLANIYGEKMDDNAFKTAESKLRFMQDLTLLAHDLNPGNDNLANQLAACIYYTTEGSFSPQNENSFDGSGGMLPFTNNVCESAGVNPTTIKNASANEQLEMIGNRLKEMQKKLDVGYQDISDVMLAFIRPGEMGGDPLKIVFSKGSDAYQRYKNFDSDGNGKGEILREDIANTIIEYAGEVENKDYLENLFHEVEPDMVTAKHLLKLYRHNMTDSYFENNELKLGFMKELTEVAKRLNPDNPNLANQLAAVINYESGNTFSSSKETDVEGSDAVGLIQFMSFTAENLGVTRDEIMSVTPLEQLQFVELYMRAYGENLWSLEDVYMAVFAPVGVGKGGDFPLYSLQDSEASYTANASRDKNGDGIITVEEASTDVLARAKSIGEVLSYLRSPRQV